MSIWLSNSVCKPLRSELTALEISIVGTENGFLASWGASTYIICRYILVTFRQGTLGANTTMAFIKANFSCMKISQKFRQNNDEKMSLYKKLWVIENIWSKFQFNAKGYVRNQINISYANNYASVIAKIFQFEKFNITYLLRNCKVKSC